VGRVFEEIVGWREDVVGGREVTAGDFRPVEE
jgi:hypothetical protein